MLSRSHYRSVPVVAGVVLFVAFFVASGCSGSDATSTSESSVSGVRVVAPEAAEDIRTSGDVVVLDVRTPEEYAEGHLPDATLIDFYSPDFETQIDALDKDARYVVYCRSGNRSGQAREAMERLGFTDVADVDGGIVAWEADGLPVVTN